MNFGPNLRGAVSLERLCASAKPFGIHVLCEFSLVRSHPFHPRKQLGGKPTRSQGAHAFGMSEVYSPPIFI